MTTRQRRPRPMAWDPTSPYSLLLPSSPADKTGAAGAIRFNTFFSHDGVGCNADETSALIRLIDARDKLTSKMGGVGGKVVGNDENFIGIGGKTRFFKELSRSYRRALSDCLAGWEARLLAQKEEGQGNGVDDYEGEVDDDNLELLKLMYAVSHLSEIYLLPSSSPRTSAFSSSTLYGEPEETLEPQGESEPGAVTADTVRYLRLHHMSSPYDIEDDEYDELQLLEENDGPVNPMEEMLNSPQPEYYNGNGKLYWSLVRKLVIRGCLNEAWAVLSRHGACRRCAASTEVASISSNRGYEADATLEEDRVAFGTLRDILLSSPLPGGRDESKDAGLPYGTDDERMTAETSELDDEEDDEDEEILMDGVPPSAYKLWDDVDTAAVMSSGRRRSRSPIEDYPTCYNANAARATFRTWRRTVEETMRSPSLSTLTRRIPALKPILFILIGRFHEANVVFRSWSEALCAELLYVLPDIRPEDVNVRAARNMAQFGISEENGAGGTGGFEEIVLSVMRGNAGRVVEALHDFGGGSGAALPATMTALLCNLLTGAGLIPARTGTIDIQTELLLSAAHSIISSLHSHPDVGVRLATRLLLPHATPEGDTRITASLAESLERHIPQGDAEAKSLIRLCDDLLKRGSIRVLDGCTNLAMCRYRHYISDGRPGGATFWLLRGLECENKLPEKYQVMGIGICWRQMKMLCGTAARTLARSLARYRSLEEVAQSVEVGQAIVSSIKDDRTVANDASKIPDVKLLSHIVNVAVATVNADDAEAARNIVACLEDRIDEDDDGVECTLAHRAVYRDLMTLAYFIMDREENDDNDVEGGSKRGNKYGSAFDVHGIHTLLARLNDLSSGTLESVMSSYNKIPLDINEKTDEEKAFTDDQMRIALSKGLMRAFVSENAKKRNTGRTMAGRLSSVGMAGRAEPLNNIDLILGPSM